MTFADKHIINSYMQLLSGLSDASKLSLIAGLEKSIGEKQDAKTKAFFQSFGSFASNESASDMANDIKASRKFRTKELEF